ncbi:conjugal transfer protein TraG N-terminal domain-containing protein [Thalassotalea marina]|uniref:TraG N-terminal Proteobacteria domain-containing protein n=1 Tax=Thalassotalea marina TaxID=1673741 RepID=A0A919BRG9_9GAMM|nr:conjugal transfer protein TraG N-terminal domain-containing protein [Thalassotalea marina]GHG07128.1 hypothetical protein GCM10017161_41000 [Thalassotalea marina]
MKRYLLLLCTFVSPACFADVDYYTYGGFQAVVNAFLRLSAIFSDPDYDYYIFAIAIAGVVVGYLIALGKGFLSGGMKGADALVSLFLVIFGVTIYTVIIRPTTTVHIYDETTNQYQSVGNIPTLIANAVHLPNVLERGMTRIVDNGTVYTRSEHANGASLELLLNALNGNPLSHDTYLNRSLYSFVDTCMPPALNSNLYGFDLNVMMSSTNNLLSELEKLKSLSVPVMYFDNANRGGIEVSCETAYNSLAVILALPSTYDRYRSAMCEKSGFDSGNAAQIAICQARLKEMADLVFGAGTISSDTHLYMSQAIAKTTYETLSNYSGTAISDISNYREMSQGYGNVIVSEGWIPTIRSSTLVIILSLLPILVLFLVTPMLFKSLHLIITLFIFVGLWGVSDAIVHNIIVDQISDLVASLSSYNGSITSFMKAPTDINKSLATFGKLQSMAVILAGFIAAVFFKLSARAFSQMGERLADNVESLGANTGQMVLDPTQQVHTMEGYAAAYEKLTLQRDVGQQAYREAIGGHSTASTRTEQKWLDSMSPNYSYNDALDIRSQNYAGDEAGRITATKDRADHNGQSTLDYSKGLSGTRTGLNNAATEVDQQNLENIAQTTGTNSIDATTIKAQISKASDTGQLRASTSPEEHVKTAETRTALHIAETQIDRDNIRAVAQENGTDEKQAIQDFSAIRKSSETGRILASATPDEHVDTSFVSSVQNMQDKLGYRAVAEQQGKTVGRKAFEEFTLGHQIKAGDHIGLTSFLAEQGIGGIEWGARKQNTELEGVESTAQGREFIVSEGLADNTLDVALGMTLGQDGDFYAQHLAKVGMSDITGLSMGQTYLAANAHVNQAIDKNLANMFLEAANIDEGKRNAILQTKQQLEDIVAGKADGIKLPSGWESYETLTAMELDNIEGGFEGSPFVAQMSKEQAQHNLNLIDEDIVNFGEQFEGQLDALAASRGGNAEFLLAMTPGGKADVAKIDTRTGDSIHEDNSITIKEGFETTSQTAYDHIFSEGNDEQAIRYLDLATATSSSLKDVAYELTKQLYGHQDQRNSNDFTSTNTAIGRANATVSKQSIADSVSDNSKDEVKLKDGSGNTATSDNKAGSKPDSKLSKLAKVVPGDIAIGGELSTSGQWSEGEQSSLVNDVNQTRIAQYLTSYAFEEDKAKALDQLRDNMAALVRDDIRVATEAEKQHQVDFVSETTDDRGIMEKIKDWGGEVIDDAHDFIVGKEVDR